MLPANARPRAISIVVLVQRYERKRPSAMMLSYIPILFGLPPEGFPVSVRGRAAFPVPRGRGGARADARPAPVHPASHVGVCVCRPWWPAWKVLPRVAFRRKPYPTPSASVASEPGRRRPPARQPLGKLYESSSRQRRQRQRHARLAGPCGFCQTTTCLS
jgi:hypothetical protein